MTKARKLTIDIVTYAYSDILDDENLYSILGVNRQSLVASINRRLSIFSARQARRAVTERYEKISRDFNDFISRRKSGLNRAISLVLTFAQEDIANGVRGLFEYPTHSFTAKEIYDILQTHDDFAYQTGVEGVSKKLTDFQRGSAAPLLFSCRRNGPKVLLHKERNIKDNFSTIILDEKAINEEVASSIFMISSNSIHDAVALDKLAPEESLSHLLSASTKFYHIMPPSSKEFIDFYIPHKDRVHMKRIYAMDGDYKLISQQVVDPSTLLRIREMYESG